MYSGLRFWPLLLLIALAGCAGTSASNGAPMPTPTRPGSPTPTPSPVPATEQVVLVVLENHSFSQVIGSPSMPYLNSLAAQHALAGNYFADTHPSIGNYFMLT